MVYRKRLRTLIGILKDKASMIKATLCNTNSNYSTAYVAVLSATTHDDSPPPPETIAAVLSLGQGSRPTACACVESLMDRLHGTQNATVALKCLLTVHNVLAKGSFIIKDQLSIYPSFGGRNYLNLSTFKDHSDPEMWELSSWVRWYAGFLEQNVAVSRIGSDGDKEERVLGLLNSDLLAELDVLIEFVGRVSDSPGSSLNNSLVYEVLRLVGEDFRLAQREIFVRVVEIGERVGDMSLSELTWSLDALEKLESCKESLFSVFVRKNDGFWDLVKESRTKVVAMVKENREGKMLIIKVKSIDEPNELVRFRNGSAGSEQLVRFSSGGGWLGMNRGSCNTVSAIG
ncbi:hypothetical protein HS088_TW11G00251 [Tripterygium wilfordii]|uniref:ENTH domain-containing protein n=1 Tax=Tripterygium wilfordii TaxID=458696 RepID=A0A7J7D1D9_TRIWF|nr:putative clathrin assembly protein At4g40080 [Tripterygium wilfordii]KAF5740185.1 hypothetical protein HS088_TW11G00251 [Tripterygium wilfordii]